MTAPVARRPLIAVTGRPVGRRGTGWPRPGAAAVPRDYLDALWSAGSWPAVLDAAAFDATDSGEAAALLARFDGLLLTGGPDVDPANYGEAPHPKTYGVDPVADAFEIALVRAAAASAVPTLAICRGIQVVNVAFGGTLYQHLPDDPGVAPHGTPGVEGGAREHDVDIEPDSLLADAMGTKTARCSCHHHQAIARVADGLRVTARAADGVVEGLQADGAWLLAVQWHPEDTAAADPTQHRLFDALTESCLKR